MAKAYWISTYRAIRDPEKVALYGAAAGPAIRAHGGVMLGAGIPAYAFELGEALRTVLIEFPSVQAAFDCHESAEYQAACALMEGAVDRDQRILEGVA
jgi:uncharacterized protein (DUF1330 family)